MFPRADHFHYYFSQQKHVQEFKKMNRDTNNQTYGMYAAIFGGYLWGLFFCVWWLQYLSSGDEGHRLLFGVKILGDKNSYPLPPKCEGKN